ncbi:hypothetical protein ABEB36_012032 [Hypothenemus hampei]|uniref:Lebercilin domain-containing protein n=1 Tax=Hypothenemus hampei TaxID=57062 RepID=A0ABD1EBV5_HYPHA
MTSNRTVPLQKSSSTISSGNENRSNSCTSNSSCFFRKRKPMNPLAYSIRPQYHKTNNPVKQRVMSAKLLKLRQLQSQLNDANYHLAEVARENQTLKTLQKRQDKALNKYENTNADLPRLIHSHAEEIRVLTERNRCLKRHVRELTEQLKMKDEELVKMRDQLSHLEKLNKDKHLEEREKLTDLMEDYKVKLQKTEEQVNVLNRKLLLESKTSKQRLNAEIAKHKQCQKELLQAFDEIEKLSGLLDAKENVARPKNQLLINRGSLLSMKVQSRKSTEKVTPVTEVKLEPLNIVKKEPQLNGFIMNPEANIKRRLSSGSHKIHEDLNKPSSEGSSEIFKSRPNSSMKLEKLPQMQESEKIKTKMKNEELIVRFNSEDKNDSQDDYEDFQEFLWKQSKFDDERLLNNEMNDEEKDVEKIAEKLDKVIRKATESSKDQLDNNLTEYCSDMLNNVKTCSKVIELHKESLKHSKLDTNNLMTSFKETEKLETKLKTSFFNGEVDDIDFVKEILNEERKFQLEHNLMENKSDKNERNGSLLGNSMGKQKLLATLRAIDNGESIDSLDGEISQNNLLKGIVSNEMH